MIHPSLEYCSQIWGSSTVSLLDRVESKAFRLISDLTIPSKIDSPPFSEMYPLYPSSIVTISVAALMSWRVVFTLPFLEHGKPTSP